MKLEVRIVLAILLALLIGGVVVYFGSLRETNKANVQTIHEQAGTAETTSHVAADLGSKTQDAQHFDFTITDARGKYAQQAEELKKSDPDVSAWSSTPVPLRLRDLARARRAARDGPTDPQAGGDPADVPSGGGGTHPAP